MTNVVNLSGEVVFPTAPGEPDMNVVRELEDLLEKARSGEIVGIAASYTYRDYATGSKLTGVTSYSLVGRLEEVKADILKSLA